MRNVKAIADKSEVLQRIVGSPQMRFQDRFREVGLDSVPAVSTRAYMPRQAA
jgi:hypothetical protein